MPAKLTSKNKQEKKDEIEMEDPNGVIEAGIDQALKVLFVTPKPVQPTPPGMSNGALFAVAGMLADAQSMLETGPDQDDVMMEADTVDNTIKEAFNTVSMVVTGHDQFVLAMKASMETFQQEELMRKITEEDKDLLSQIDGMQF
jgi:hypothetical protein